MRPPNEAARLVVIRSCCRGTILTCLNEYAERTVAGVLAEQKQQARDTIGPHNPHHVTLEEWQRRGDAAANGVARPAVDGNMVNNALFAMPLQGS